MTIPKSFGVILLSVAVPAFLLGCGGGGSARPGSQDQLATLRQVQPPKSDPTPQILAQANQTTLNAYKDYKVGPEDLLEVNFFGQEDLFREARVNGNGEVSLPLIGAISVSGRSPQEIEAHLVQAYKAGRFIKDPQISVAVKEYRHQRVMVTGAVATPGSYEVIGPRTLLEMLGKAGGIIDKPEMKAGDLVYVARSQNAPAMRKPAKGAGEPAQPPTNMVIDLRRLMSGNAPELNIPIKSGDVIYVPPARMAFVLGAVKKPGQVPVRDNLTVTQAVAMTEGQDVILSSNRITVLRFDERGERQVMPVNLKNITSGTEADPLLKPNDIVFVHESGLRRFLFDVRNFVPGSIGLGAAPF